MSMTVYTAHVLAKSENESAYFELSFDNEMNPELAIKDSIGAFIDEFKNSKGRKKLISDAFDANYNWDDEKPYTLEDGVEDVSDYDASVSKEYKKFCKAIKEMQNPKYVLFAVDSDKPDWLGYSTYWYDAMAFDFDNHRLITIEWRGSELKDDPEYWEKKPFYKSTAENLIQMIEADKTNQIDVGDFMLNGKSAGKVAVEEIQVKEKVTKSVDAANTPIEASDITEAEQIERINSLIQRVDSIDFENKTFVFDTLAYIKVKGVFCGPDSPNHPTVKKVLDAGGLMRKGVSGKTNYLVINTNSVKPGAGVKCRDALIQIDKGKDIKIITLANLLELIDR